MESKNEKVRRLVARGEYKQALQICKEWNYEDPSHREILRLGYECLMYPDFYTQIGYDPDIRYKDAIEVLHKVYSTSSRESS